MEINENQLAKALSFKSLHERSEIFVAPNPWDAGSAKMLQQLGFEALATTSGGAAFSLGRPDAEGLLSRDETLLHVGSIVNATDLPVTADLENGYGDSPEDCVETILLAAKYGTVGGSIEDVSRHSTNTFYSIADSAMRVEAAVKAARSLPFPFMLTARADNLIHGRNDLKDTLNRLEAFAAAGADVLLAPGLTTKEQIALAVKTVFPKPLHVIMGIAGVQLTVNDLQELGVKRISVGSALARAAYDAFYRGAREIRQQGSFDFASEIMSYSTINSLFR